MKIQDHKTYPKWQVQVRMHGSSKLDILEHLMGTNRHPSTNIYKGLFMAHYMYKYKS